MNTHTFSLETNLNCSSVLSSIEEVNGMCDELMLASTISDKVKPALKAVQLTTQIILEPMLHSEYARNQSKELPVRVKTVICAPYGC